MIVLVLNCGSTSVKFAVIATGHASARRLAAGRVERVGGEATVVFEADGGATVRSSEVLADHVDAVRRVVDWVTEAARLPRIEAVGHRVVHGGDRFTTPAVVDDAVVSAIEALETLAPLHNAPSLAGIRAARATLGADVPMVAAFDTAFHAALPEAAARYAIPDDLARRHRVRRYGFHGLAYRSVLAGYARAAGVSPDAARIVALHLGGGCSAAAIAGGRSLDTSMGFTPLEGLVMTTRSGDLDPALVDHLAAREGVPAAEVVGWLNQRSGLLGLSGTSGDVRDLLAREAHDPRARLALEVFVHRARKYVGAYLAVLGGADAVVFSGGIGEYSATVRTRIGAGFGWCGLALDEARNAAVAGGARRISADGARLAAWVVPADEETVIAEDTVTRVAARSIA
ncbi:MAG TPA: acetate/propionate family kinase [Methylomirabilota bacterium]|nr:acetate/propionate family kinase [Methylomirabilota bacterium]